MDRREAIRKHLEGLHSTLWGQAFDVGGTKKGMDGAIDLIEETFTAVEGILEEDSAKKVMDAAIASNPTMQAPIRVPARP